MILGINSFTHDVSIALITPEHPILLLEEERFSRRKHHDGILFSGLPPYKILAEVPESAKLDRICHSRAIDHAAKRFNIAQNIFLDFAKELDPSLKISDFRNHHLCHAASTYYCSDFKNAYICTLDSRGDGLSSTISIGTGAKIEKLAEIPARSSICAVYSYATEILGLGRRKEGSLTGLAAHGKRYDLIPQLFKWSGYSFIIDGISTLENLARSATDFQQKADIAYSIQFSFANSIIEMLNDVCSDKSVNNLALAGGGFLNSRLNQVLAEYGRWQEIFVTPASGDSGTALGAALLALDEPDRFRLQHSFWGSSYSEKDVEEVIKECNLKANKTSAEEISELIASGLIGGVFDGAMEFGPRALGHRSIVGDPRKKNTKVRLNSIKGRQWWRPVAPSVLHQYGQYWFENYKYSPYMTRTFTVKEEKKFQIPSAVHVDGTARIQSVTKEVGFLYDILTVFHEMTNVPILCNTSFNVQAPIIRTPKEAIATFFTSNLDFLYCQGWLFRK